MNYRVLTPNEISQLESLGNTCSQWERILVSDPFDATLLRNNALYGDIRIGSLQPDGAGDAVAMPVGIYGCMLRNVTVGNQCSLHQVGMLSGYTIGNNCQLFHVDEMTADRSGQPVWMEPMNENGGRRILPFSGMTIADAYLWGKYRDRQRLIQRLEKFTRQRLDSAEGCYGHVGSHATVKNTRTIRNVAILSDEQAPSRIEDCVVLSDGVVGYGCVVEYGCMLLRFLLGEHVHIELGARINDTVVGDNSTIARCEVGNSLIYPAHEQHHNNSFLIASTIMGQSNLAAGCTIGSNHNGRTADNEIVAGRGFWPGLCTSLKHSSSFASYTLLAKGAYPAELSITLPFSLVSNNESRNRLEIMPAYWWMYNMYALDRNSRKFAARDKRQKKAQHIEFSPLAPDTVEEIFNARQLLRFWTEQAYLGFDKSDTKVEILAYGMEKGRRKAVVTKAAKGYQAYEDMLTYYAMGILADGNTASPLPDASLAEGAREREWANLGGQLVPQCKVDALILDIEQGSIDSWEAIHNRMEQWWTDYPAWKRAHAYHTLCEVLQCRQLSAEQWQHLLARYATLQRFVSDQVRITRQKDDTNPFRQQTYRNDAEMKAVLQ